MPGASEPRDPARPSTRAGASLAARAASASGTPVARACATSRSSVLVPPAIAPPSPSRPPWEASRATPPDTITGSDPST
jgi:hypothetical protein